MAFGGGLSEIAQRHGTDKGPRENAYTLVYDMLLSPMRMLPIRLMEIGLARGGPEVGGSADREVVDIPSVRMWREFLPQAHIYGVDISDFSAFQQEWFTFFRADCGAAEQLRAISDQVEPLDVIVDDGSHASFHQKTAFVELFGRLKPGGLFIVEDLSWQPKEYEASLPPTPKMAQILFELSETGSSRHIPKHISDSISIISIYDEDQLIRLRRYYNTVRGLKPVWGHYADGTVGPFQMTKRRMRRIAEHALGLLDTLVGRRRVVPRAKLAVIQKSIAATA